MKLMSEIKRPGHDIHNPDHVKSAKTVIKRRRTEFEKKTRRRLPLFADHIISEYKDASVESVLEQRRLAGESIQEFFSKMRKDNAARGRELRTEARVLCANDEEFFRLMRKALRVLCGQDKAYRWSYIIGKLKRRLQPLTINEDLVLAWLEQESEPVTHHELYLRRGDGVPRNEILEALQRLLDRELVTHAGLKKVKGCEWYEGEALAWRIANKNNPQSKE